MHKGTESYADLYQCDLVAVYIALSGKADERSEEVLDRSSQGSVDLLSHHLVKGIEKNVRKRPPRLGARTF